MPAANTPLAIWERILTPDPAMPPETACYLLRLDFTPADHARMEDLSGKAEAGTLTPAEQAELDDYVRVGHQLALLQSKARVALRQLAAANGHG
jgi:hypothetical protein